MPIKFYILAGLLVVILGLGLNTCRLNDKVEGLQVTVALAGVINKDNVENVEDLAKRLTECEGKNALLERDSQQAVTKLREELNKTREKVRNATKQVQHSVDECADIAIPSDIERVLREGAARTH
jgi:methyl-accepting chemotaxis protein